MQLWPHQQNALRICREHHAASSSRVLVQLPPGTGKTEVGVLAALEWVKGGPFRRALIAVTTGPILQQYYRRLVALTALPVAIEKATRTDLHQSRIVVASQATLWSRLEKYPSETLCIIDECHHANYDAPENLRLLRRFDHVVGLSATPWSSGCRQLFNHSAHSFLSLRQAQEACLVAPFAVREWESVHGPWALVFCSTNRECAERSAKHPRSSWIGVNVAAAQVAERIRAWRGRRLDVLYVNRMLLEGFDESRCSSVWIAKDCDSDIMIVQMVGRALRYLPGKSAHIYCTSPDMLKRVQAALERLNHPTF